MLGTESFDLSEEKPSYLDDLIGPGANKVGGEKVAEQEIGQIQ